MRDISTLTGGTTFYILHALGILCVMCRQAEEQLKLVDEQRKVLEERQARERLERMKQGSEQAIILNKKDKKRPKLSFSLGPK